MDTDAPPQLGEIAQRSELSLPTLKSTMNNNSTNGAFQNAKNAVSPCSRDTVTTIDRPITDTQAALNTVQNHPGKFLFPTNAFTLSLEAQGTQEPNVEERHPNAYPRAGLLTANASIATQNMRDTVGNGPLAESVKDQRAKATSEFQNLADSRTPPSQSTATGQPLTHYHSFFYSLLSWENPRATSVAFLSSVLVIFACRYLPALRWSFKMLSYALGITASAELAGKLAFGSGFAAAIRPKKYYTIPRETLEASLEDVEQLINFFVIEFQRILFAENVTATFAAFFAAFLSYWLIKFTPLWGLSLIATSTIYLTPLIYKSNKEFIDAHLENASNVVNSQAAQVKDLTAHHVGRYSETAKQYAGDYTAKAQSYMGGRGRSTSPETNSSLPANAPAKSEPGDAPSYQASDFPHAPKQEPTPGTTSHQEQYENSQFGGQAQPAY